MYSIYIYKLHPLFKDKNWIILGNKTGNFTIKIIFDPIEDKVLFTKENKILYSYFLNITKRNVHTCSEISEVTINKCYKKLDKFRNELIPEIISKKYSY